MNDWDIAEAVDQYADEPVMGPAVHTIANLAEWANHNSDGWHSWPKPARAANKLMELIERQQKVDREGDWHIPAGGPTPPVTAAEVRKALAPIKAFRTRQGADFTIESA
ncbi:MAG: hypothetical protein M3Q39_15905 [Actinomycetota bacterium]|nr:hypothetical protein [Actinomycetota bacterium]